MVKRMVARVSTPTRTSSLAPDLLASPTQAAPRRWSSTSSTSLGTLATLVAVVALAACNVACGDRGRSGDRMGATPASVDSSDPAEILPGTLAEGATGTTDTGHAGESGRHDGANADTTTNAGRTAATTTKDPFAEPITKHLHAVPDPQITYTEDRVQVESLDNQAFRDRVVRFARQVATGGERASCDVRLAIDQPMKALIWLFHEGRVVGRGLVADRDLCVAVKQATRQAIAATGNDRAMVQNGRIVVELRDHDYSMVEHGERGVELSHGLVPVRKFDKTLLAQRIDAGKAYLRRVINAEHNGVHKYYRAPSDAFESKLHTIYTASTVFTLLKLYAYDGDRTLLADIERATEFLLSMQSRDQRARSYGGFFYSYDLDRQRPSKKLVVGTTSKTIFTLIELHALTQDQAKKDRYMEAANLAATWLMSMQRPDGSVRSYLRKTSSGRWRFSKKESMLYTGQVLSALSRMYRATGEEMYRDAAQQTAGYIASKISRDGCFLGDEYRKPNPISTSWAILSLFDFVRATDDPTMKDLVFTCSGELLSRQIRDSNDVYRYGRWQGSLSSSGNGWLAEVMSELYIYCRQNKMGGCGNFKKAITRVLRLLMQYTYTPESSFVIKNPEMARGGTFWNVAERYVRTDSVCHAMNAYVYMMPYLDDGTLLEVPEPPLAERLSARRVGQGAGPVPGQSAEDRAAGVEPIMEDDSEADGEDAAADAEEPANAAGEAPAAR